MLRDRSTTLLMVFPREQQNEGPKRIYIRTERVCFTLDEDNDNFIMSDGSEYMLIERISTLARCKKVRKKVLYLMDTVTKNIASHTMILYDYIHEGNIPRTFYSAKCKPITCNDETNPHNLTKVDKTEKCPFLLPTKTASGGTFFLQLADSAFRSDNNRHIEYLVN